MRILVRPSRYVWVIVWQGPELEREHPVPSLFRMAPRPLPHSSEHALTASRHLVLLLPMLSGGSHLPFRNRLPPLPGRLLCRSNLRIHL